MLHPKIVKTVWSCQTADQIQSCFSFYNHTKNIFDTQELKALIDARLDYLMMRLDRDLLQEKYNELCDYILKKKV